MKNIRMNYNISFPEMNRLARPIKSKKASVSLKQMKEQAALLKSTNVSKVKKQSI